MGNLVIAWRLPGGVQRPAEGLGVELVPET